MTFRERAAEIRKTRPQDGDLMTDAYKWYNAVIDLVLDLVDAMAAKADQ